MAPTSAVIKHFTNCFGNNTTPPAALPAADDLPSSVVVTENREFFAKFNKFRTFST
jgi:hypothetical protein